MAPNHFGTRDRFHGRQFFHELGDEGWFRDDSQKEQATQIDPSHAQFTVAFMPLRESNAAADPTGGRAQWWGVMGSGRKHRWSFTRSPAAHLLLCGPVPNRPQVASGLGPGASFGDPCSKRPEKAMVPHSSTLAWKIPWMEEPGRLQSMRSLRVGHDWATSLSLSCIGGGNDNPLQCSCLENPRDGGAWWAAVSGVAQSRTRLKRLSSSSSSSSSKEQ